MRQVTAAHRAALAGVHSYVNVIQFEISDTTYFLTDDDLEVEFEGRTYFPKFIIDLGDVEVTSEPKTGSIDVVLDAVDQTYVGLALSGFTTGKKYVQKRLTMDVNGQTVGSLEVFAGTIDNFRLSDRRDTITLSVSSVFANYDKQTGIYTNVASQQRYFPLDTGFRHAPNATNDVPWGRDVATEQNRSSGGSSISNPRVALV